MGRNKLSTDDRIKIDMTEIHNLVLENNQKKIMKHIKTIRSKTLRYLCVFCWAKMDNFLFMTEHKKVIAKAFGIGERKVYDLIKTINFIEACGDAGFTTMFENKNGYMETTKENTPK